MKLKEMDLDGANRLPSDIIMGIDLGTTNSAVSIFGTGAVPSLAPMGANGKTTLQSCVRWDGEDKFTVGPEAYEERYKSNVVYSVKRIMGSGKTITLEREDGQTLTLTPAEVSSKILRALADKVAETYRSLTRCIITVPAYFNQRQIEDTMEASRLAGLECIQILKEPTSASYIYSGLGYASDGSVLIYDLGGGTFDVTHMSFLKKDKISSKLKNALKRMYEIDVDGIQNEGTSLYYCRVLGTYGDMNLGGDDIDEELARIAVKKDELKLSRDEFEQLKLRCEQFKKSSIEAADIVVGENKIHLSRPDLREATRVIFNRTLAIIDQISEEELSSIRTIVLVGGSTKSPFIVEMLNEAFPGKEVSRVLDPDATVALGAGAVAKDLYEGKGLMYQDVLPMAIGVLSSETQVDMCVAKNTALPYSMSKVYYTMYDNQEAISVEVYQGVSSDPKQCVHLGRLRVAGLPKKPAGELAVQIYFMLNANGRLTVSTVIEGVMEEHRLEIDSIFNVAQESVMSETDDAAKEFGFDEFEKSLADLLAKNPEASKLIMERRKALEDGMMNEAERLEEEIIGLL